MNTFSNHNATPKPSDWGIIGTRPFIEINVSPASKNHYVGEKPGTARLPVKQKQAVSRKGIDAGSCTAEKIPGELFKKNEKLSLFMDNINHCR